MIEQLELIWNQLSDDDRLTLMLTLFRDLTPAKQERIINLLATE